MRAVAVALVLLVGCKDKWEKAVGELDGFKDRMCACKDKACMDGVDKELDAWKMSLVEAIKKDEKPPEVLMTKGDKIDHEIRDCKKALKKSLGLDTNALNKMIELKDQACACTDSACAEKVSNAMSEWAMTQSKIVDPEPVDESVSKRMADVSQQYSACMTKAMTPPPSPP